MIKIEVWGVGHAIIYYVSQTITVTIQAKSWLAKTNTNTDNFKCIPQGLHQVRFHQAPKVTEFRALRIFFAMNYC